MRTLIWDFNGTIINDMELCLNIENRMLKERHMNRVVSMEEYRQMFCFPVIDYYCKIGYTFQDESYDDISIEFARLYEEGFRDCRLMDGFAEKIQESRQKGYRSIILSVSEKKMLMRQCAELGILDDFDEILGTENLHAVSKLETARQWMERTDVRPEECMCIGDTTHDAETAQALHCSCVLVACGHMTKKRLLTACSNVADSIREIQL